MPEMNWGYKYYWYFNGHLNVFLWKISHLKRIVAEADMLMVNVIFERNLKIKLLPWSQLLHVPVNVHDCIFFMITSLYSYENASTEVRIIITGISGVIFLIYS